VQQDVAGRRDRDALAATRWPAPNSRNGCSDAGRGSPNSVSHASEPKPHTQVRLPPGTRLPTERTSAAMSPHHERIVSA